MGITDLKSGYGMTNRQFIDWLTVRVRDKEKGPITMPEAAEILQKVADLNEPLSDFVYYLQHHIGSVRGVTDPAALKAVFDKVQAMVEDYNAHPETYKF